MSFGDQRFTNGHNFGAHGQQFHHANGPNANNVTNNNWSQQNNIMGAQGTLHHDHIMNQNQEMRHLQNQNTNGSHARNSFGGNSMGNTLLASMTNSAPLTHHNERWVAPGQQQLATEAPTNHAQRNLREPQVAAPGDTPSREKKKRSTRSEVPTGRNEFVQVVPLPGDPHVDPSLNLNGNNNRMVDESQTSRTNRGLPYQNAQVTVTSLPRGANQVSVHHAHAGQRGPNEMQNLEQHNNFSRTNTFETRHQSVRQGAVQPMNGHNPNFERTHQYQFHTGTGGMKPGESASHQNGQNIQSPEMRRRFGDGYGTVEVNSGNGWNRGIQQQQHNTNGLQFERNQQYNAGIRGLDNGQAASQQYLGNSLRINDGNCFMPDLTPFPFDPAPTGLLTFAKPPFQGAANNHQNRRQPDQQLHPQMASQSSVGHLNMSQNHDQQQALRRLHTLTHNPNHNMHLQNAEMQRKVLYAQTDEERRKRAEYEEHLRSMQFNPIMSGMEQGPRSQPNLNPNQELVIQQELEQYERSRNRYSPYKKESNSTDRKPSPSLSFFNNQQSISASGHNGQDFLQQAKEEQRRMLTPTDQSATSGHDPEIQIIYEKKGIPQPQHEHQFQRNCE